VKVVLIASGGMDSATLAYDYAARGADIHMLTFDYGQRHARECGAAAALSKRIGARWSLMPISWLGGMLAGSSLTDASVPVPHGHYAADNMRSTVVPNRNMVMLSLAAAVAVSEDADVIGTAVHAGDHFIYPDCRPQFIDAVDLAIRVGNAGFGSPALRVEAPFLLWTKAAIAARGAVLGVPFADTWSCYEGGDVHCGKCGTCVERREAFDLAGISDPTEYA